MKIPFLSEYIGYFKTLHQFAGRSLYVLLGLSLLVAITDGIGITMLLPLLETSNMGGSDLGAGVFEKVFEALGIPQTFGWTLALMGLVFTLKGLIKFSEGYLKARITADLFTKWRRQLLDLYKGLEYQYYVSKNTGHFTNVINGQTNTSAVFAQQYTAFTSRALTATVYLSLAFALNAQFTLMAIAAGGSVLLILRGVMKKTKEISQLNAQETGTLNKFLIQILQSFKYLQGSGRFAFLQKEADISLDKIRHYRMEAGKFAAIMQSLQEPLAVFFMLGIMWFQVAYLGNEIAPILVTLVLFYRSMNTLMMAQGQWQGVLGKSGSIEMVSKEFEEVRPQQEKSGGEVFEEFSEELAFKNLDFSYGDTPVLHQVSFSIPKNQTVALVGESGSGKTTVTDIISLLLKPGEGGLYIDGKAAESYELNSWRKRIGFVTQDSVIFDDSVGNNITLWEGDYATDPQVQDAAAHAAEQAYCHHFIKDLPQGYHTQIGERGVKLSGGQKQRLSIARELYKQPEILILDEATSALDTESERYIQESIDALKGKMTVIIIAHRLSTIKNADKIVVLEKGRILEEGSFQELTQQDTRFKRMAELQKL